METSSIAEESVNPFRFRLRPRKGTFLRIKPDSIEDQVFFEDFDLIYRTLCSILYNFAPLSGHPGGSISSGKIVAGLLFSGMDYNFNNPGTPEADQIVYAAGHKAMGLYAMWALRNEIVRIAKPEMLPEEKLQLRLEDLLGFRRNPTQPTPLFKKFGAKALDGHPSPMVPFVPLATGASGVGLASGLGLAMGIIDIYGRRGPRVHLIEGEGGMTPGRVQEVLAAAATGGLENVTLHVDWNQASIDSNRVCPEGSHPGDYVQWNPLELLRMHDWNVVFAGDGHDFRRVLTAQKEAAKIRNGQPTAIVYKTVKGWNYGIEGAKSHGGGHPFCSVGFFEALKPFENRFQIQFPRFTGAETPESVESSYYETLLCIRKVLETRTGFTALGGRRIAEAASRLKADVRAPRVKAPNLDLFYSAGFKPEETPEALRLSPGKSVTVRGALGDFLSHVNQWTNGAVLGAAADLAASTSLSNLNAGFPGDMFHAASNPGSRILSIGGICEDGMGGWMSGVSTYGRHIGVTSSYAAFIAALEHVPARLHAIGQQFRKAVDGRPFNTWIIINGHAGSMTGEDGPTHADPQCLQLLQGNFPRGCAITLTPWEPTEIWPLMIAGLMARPAVLAPYIVRPAVPVVDRQALRLPPAHAAVKGVVQMRKAPGKAAVVIQGCASATVFFNEVLPRLDKEGIELNVYYVYSAELFELLDENERAGIFSEETARNAFGITDFTVPTLYRWIRSDAGIKHSLHPFHGDEYLGSGKWQQVLVEARLDAAAQYQAVREWCDSHK